MSTHLHSHLRVCSARMKRPWLDVVSEESDNECDAENPLEIFDTSTNPVRVFLIGKVGHVLQPRGLRLSLVRD